MGMMKVLICPPHRKTWGYVSLVLLYKVLLHNCYIEDLYIMTVYL